MDAREAVLGRIRTALAAGSSREEDVPLDRRYRRRDDAAREAVLALFAERVEDYRATVHRLPEADLPAAIAAACRRRGVRRLAVPMDTPREWLPAGVEILGDESLSPPILDAVDGVLTGCALGIAQTGTIVLDGGERQGRRALSLLPDYHLCVVFAGQVVGIVPEAIERLRDAARGGKPITFISGPSATSDIELNRVEGVHGPRTLEVLLVERGEDGD